MNNRYFNKDAEHRELKALVDDWVAKGGKITQCPPGRAKGLPATSQYYRSSSDDLGLQVSYEGKSYIGEGTTRKVPIRYD